MCISAEYIYMYLLNVYVVIMYLLDTCMLKMNVVNIYVVRVCLPIAE